MFEFISLDEWDKKVKAGFRDGVNLETGDSYSGFLGGLVSSLQVVEDMHTWATEAELAQALQVLGFNHVIDRHCNSNRNAGQFTISQDKLKSILSNKSTVNIPVKEIPGNQFERIVDIGEIAGTVKPSLPNVGGQSTNYIRIITDKAGNLVTTYPIPKP